MSRRSSNLRRRVVSNTFVDDFIKIIDGALRNKKAPWTKYYDRLERKTGITRAFLFFTTAALVAFYLVVGWKANFVCNFIGIVFPVYLTIEALKEKSGNRNRTKWITTYWAIFAVCNIVDYVSFLLKDLVPCYYLLKTIFFVWCMLPIENNGSMYIYHTYVWPYFNNSNNYNSSELSHRSRSHSGVSLRSQQGSSVGSQLAMLARRDRRIIPALIFFVLLTIQAMQTFFL